MTVKEIKTELKAFVFAPISPYPLAAFRITLGLCVCATLLLLRADWLTWFGTNAWIRPETIAKAEGGFRLNLFALIPRDDSWINLTFWLFLVASLCLIAGFFTKTSTIIVFLALNSMNQRMPLILHGGDALLRIASFFLIFGDSGAVLSVDSLLRRRQGPVEAKTVRVSPWAQRLIQYQLAIIYLASFWWKAEGHAWRDGTALFYVLNLHEIGRFPVPAFFRSIRMIHVETWAGLAFELAFPLLVWFRRFRAKVLLAGLAFHLCLEYALNIPMFQWDMLAAYVLFLEPDSIIRTVRFIMSFSPTRRRNSTAR